MLSESRIAEIKKRKDAATPGPWMCLSAEFTKRGVNFEMVMSEKVIAFPDAEFLANSITDTYHGHIRTGTTSSGRFGATDGQGIRSTVAGDSGGNQL